MGRTAGFALSGMGAPGGHFRSTWCRGKGLQFGVREATFNPRCQVSAICSALVFLVKAGAINSLFLFT